MMNERANLGDGEEAFDLNKGFIKSDAVEVFGPCTQAILAYFLDDTAGATTAPTTTTMVTRTSMFELTTSLESTRTPVAVSKKTWPYKGGTPQQADTNTMLPRGKMMRPESWSCNYRRNNRK